MQHVRTGIGIGAAIAAVLMTTVVTAPAEAATPATVSPSATSQASAGATSTAAGTGSTATDTASPEAATDTAPTLAQQNAAGDHVMGSPSAEDGDLTTASTASTATSSTGSSLKVHSLAVASGPSSSYVRGFDISAWQANSSINWSSAYSSGARFVYIKATEATTYTSSQFSAQWSSATAAGMYRGAYVFATPNTASGAATADYFVAHGGAWSADGRTLPPLLDIENNPYGAECYGLSTSAMVSWIQSFTTEMVKKTGRTPAIYSNIAWWKTCTGNSAAFGKNPYMPAYWPSTNFASPGTLGASWTSWNMWQWADSGTFPGDQDVFNGSAASLQTYASAASAAVTLSTAIGHVDAVTPSNGAVTVGGWAADSGSSASTKVAITVGGTTTTLTANASRPDVAAAYPKLGAAHGFTTTVNAPAGSDQVCVVGYSASGGSTTPLGCSTVTVPNASPHGSFDTAVATPSGVSVGGWAIDPDTASPITVQVTVDGKTASSVTASATRTDVGRAYPAAGPDHGFSATVPVAAGNHTLCVTGVNTGRGTNATIGTCKTVRVAGSTPIGSYDAATVSGSTVSVAGWALDGDVTKPATIHVYIDGAIHAATADVARSDIARIFPYYGAAHGYAARFSGLGNGKHSVCVSVMNEGVGSTNPSLGCKTVSVANKAPIGSLDAVKTSTGSVTVNGWAIDPDTAASIQVHVYIDGVIHGLTAGTPRSDIARAYPKYGAAHGYVGTYAVAAGKHSVCVAGMDTNGGTNTQYGCRTVTVAG